MARDVFGRFSRGFGAEALVGELTALEEASEQGPQVKRALEAVGEKVVATIELMMQQVGPSPSPPGGPPAIDTGDLVASYRYVVEEGEHGITLAVGSDVEYATYLEFGTYKMEPRPHLGPGMEVGVKEAQKTIGEGIVAAQRETIGHMPPVIFL